MLDKKILNQIHTIVDELYPAKQMLRKYKNDPDVPLGFLISLITRVKIYENTKELIRRYKKGKEYTDVLNRIFHQLKLHRYQVKRLSKTHPNDHQSVHRFCVGLAALLYTAFVRQLR